MVKLATIASQLASQQWDDLAHKLKMQLEDITSLTESNLICQKLVEHQDTSPFYSYFVALIYRLKFLMV